MFNISMPYYYKPGDYHLRLFLLKDSYNDSFTFNFSYLPATALNISNSSFSLNIDSFSYQSLNLKNIGNTQLNLTLLYGGTKDIVVTPLLNYGSIGSSQVYLDINQSTTLQLEFYNNKSEPGSYNKYLRLIVS